MWIADVPLVTTWRLRLKPRVSAALRVRRYNSSVQLASIKLKGRSRIKIVERPPRTTTYNSVIRQGRGPLSWPRPCRVEAMRDARRRPRGYNRADIIRFARMQAITSSCFTQRGQRCRDRESWRRAVNDSPEVPQKIALPPIRPWETGSALHALKQHARLLTCPSSAAPGGASTLSGCCNLRGCGRPRAACQQRSTAADRVGCPPCPGFWPSRCRCCRTARPRA